MKSTQKVPKSESIRDLNTGVRKGKNCETKIRMAKIMGLSHLSHTRRADNKLSPAEALLLQNQDEMILGRLMVCPELPFSSSLLHKRMNHKRYFLGTPFVRTTLPHHPSSLSSTTKSAPSAQSSLVVDEDGDVLNRKGFMKVALEGQRAAAATRNRSTGQSSPS